MALPTIGHVTHETRLPLREKPIVYRPFTVAEQKILLTAAKGEDTKSMMRALLQVFDNCIVSEDFDVQSMRSYDIEWMWLALSSKSISNIVETKYRYNDVLYDVRVDLDAATCVLTEGHDPDNHTFKIPNDPHGIGFTAHIPPVSKLTDLLGDDSDEDIVAQIRSTLKNIFDEHAVYDVKDHSPDEINAFINDFPSQTVQEFKEYMEAQPKVSVPFSFKDNTGELVEIELVGLNNFFQLL